MSAMSAKQPPVFPVRLNVPLEQKDLAKAKGARWTGSCWTAKNPAALYKCRQWADAKNCLGLLWTKEWLDVPYKDNERAKLFGARYDIKNHCWFAPAGLASSSIKLDQWRMRHGVAQRYRICGIKW